jgi:hypothetical protein
MIENNKSQSTIPDWQVYIMLLVPFYGILCIFWLIYLLCGYPIWSLGGVDITVMKICRYVEIISTLFFMYVTVSQYRIGGIRQFSGFSIPIAVLLLMLICRQIADIWFLYYDGYFIIRGMLQLTFPIMLLAFMLPIDRDSYRRGFYWIYIVLFILSTIIIATWYDWIGSGFTMRSPSMMAAEYKTYDSFYFGAIKHSKQLTGGGGHVYLVGFIGSLLAALSIYKLLQDRQTLVKTQLGLIVGYVLGCSIVFFVGYKSIVLGLVTSGLFFICACKFWKSWKTTIKIVLLLFLSSILFCTIGYKDNNSILKRFDRFHNTLQPNIQLFMNKTDDIVKDKFQYTSVTSQPEWFIKKPYTLKTMPIFGMKGKYSIVSQKIMITEARVALYVMGVNVILDNPIFGYGTCLYVNINNQPTTISMHCNVLVIFLATGVVGGILFLYIIIRGFIDSFLIITRFPEVGWLSGIFLIAFVANIFDCYCINYTPLWIPLVAMRTFVKTQYKKISKSEQSLHKTSEIL